MARCFELATDEAVVGKLAVPMAPKFQPARLDALRLDRVADTAIEAGERLIEKREARHIPQIGKRLRLGCHHFVEQFLVELNGMVWVTLLSFVSRRRDQSVIES